MFFDKEFQASSHGVGTLGTVKRKWFVVTGTEVTGSLIHNFEQMVKKDCNYLFANLI
jgi:hypothetical protein